MALLLQGTQTPTDPLIDFQHRLIKLICDIKLPSHHEQVQKRFNMIRDAAVNKQYIVGNRTTITIKQAEDIIARATQAHHLCDQSPILDEETIVAHGTTFGRLPEWARPLALEAKEDANAEFPELTNMHSVASGTPPHEEYCPCEGNWDKCCDNPDNSVVLRRNDCGR